jgi:adenosylcobinamide amidohydrolase
VHCVSYWLGGEFLTLASSLFPEGISYVRRVSILFVDKNYCSQDPWRDVLSILGSNRDSVIFMTAARSYVMRETDWGKLVVSAGIGESGEDAGCTINVGTFVHEGLNMNGLVDLVRTVTEAKSGALRDLGYELTGTVSDAVAVGSKVGETSFAGPGTDLGRRVARDVRLVLREMLGEN